MKTNPEETAFLPFANRLNTEEDLSLMVDELATISRFLFRGKEGTIPQKAIDYMSPQMADIFGEIEKMGLEPMREKDQLKFLSGLLK